MKIPKGWRKVTRGKSRKTDKVWAKTDGRFITFGHGYDMRDRQLAGEPVSDFYCVIRRQKP